MSKKVILGIDPGTARTGYGVLEVTDVGRLYAVTLGDIDLRRIKDPYHKLRTIFEEICRLVDAYHPCEVALESPFFGENVQSMLKLGRAQGVAMAAALSRGIDVWEYAPRRVKQAVTGRGGAAKEQVAALMGGMLGIEYDPRRLDATDGMAVALCHHFTISSPLRSASSPQAGNSSSSSSSSSSAAAAAASAASRSSASRRQTSWEDFLRRNPDREIKK